MEASQAISEQRAEVDRRCFSWRTVAFGFLLSRRHEHRRAADDAVIFLDWHHPWLFFLAVGIMLLSCADAFLTLKLLNLGMVEANPVMNAIMAQGTVAFTATKLAMTAVGIFVLVFLAKARFLNRVRTGLFLTTFFSFYACLVCYELVSLFRLL
ncbi:MAG TPA: DUF5658 family protein [Woeseiaceae bacterium]|jgi:hypothetical protein|nr:DUF5658 family protein [Woeseiaceae bacterium]